MSQLGLNAEELEGLTIEDASGAIVEVVTQFDNYMNALSLKEQQEALSDLTHAVQELKYWHPDYNAKTNEIEFE